MGRSYPYVFQAKPYGTHFYHCHLGTSMHMQAGMYGALIVERPDDPVRQKFPYTQDYVYVLSSIDPIFVREQMNAMFARMRQRDALDEGVGVVEEVGAAVTGFKPGDRVLISCISTCGKCVYCRKLMYSHCTTGGWILGNRIDGTQAARAVVQPILGLAMPLHEYEPGTWGPVEAEKLTAGSCGCDSPVWLLPQGKDGLSGS